MAELELSLALLNTTLLFELLACRLAMLLEDKRALETEDAELRNELAALLTIGSAPVVILDRLELDTEGLLSPPPLPPQALKDNARASAQQARQERPKVNCIRNLL